MVEQPFIGCFLMLVVCVLLIKSTTLVLNIKGTIIMKMIVCVANYVRGWNRI